MKTIQIKVSKRGGPSVKVPFSVPETDAEWQKVCPRNGTADRDKLAQQQLVVKAQAAVREHLNDTVADKGAAEITKALAGFTYDPQRERAARGPKKVKLDTAAIKKEKSPEAIIAAMRAALAAQGVEIEV